MDQDFEIFSHWTFESFAPGSISRRKYDAFRRIQESSSKCLRLLGEIESLDTILVDWARASTLIGTLAGEIRALVEQLRIMNPMEFMDVHEWFSKVEFYVRLAMDRVDEKAGPPYLREISAWNEEDSAWLHTFLRGEDRTPCLIITPALYQYFVEVNSLHDILEKMLSGCNADDLSTLAAVEEEMSSLIHSGRLPQRLSDELEIAAVDLAPGGGTLDVWSFIGSEERRSFLGGECGVQTKDIVSAWKRAVVRKFSPAALLIRLSQGLADGEDAITVVAHRSGVAEPMPASPAISDASAFGDRLHAVLPLVTHLHVFRGEDSVRPEQCRSLYDLLCLCLDRGLAQVFAFAGEPGKGLAGVKQMRLDIPVTVNVFNLGDAFFPSVAERTVISVEDIRSIPAWSFFLGLACSAITWPPLAQPGASPRHHGSYAVLSQFFMHCTLRLNQNLFTVECHCADHARQYVHFRFKGVRQQKGEHDGRQEIMLRVLEEEGFLVHICGEYLEATRTAQDDVVLQRNLACLGLLTAWVQTDDGQMETLGPDQGMEMFQTLLTTAFDPS